MSDLREVRRALSEAAARERSESAPRLPPARVGVNGQVYSLASKKPAKLSKSASAIDFAKVQHMGSTGGATGALLREFHEEGLLPLSAVAAVVAKAAGSLPAKQPPAPARPFTADTNMGGNPRGLGGLGGVGGMNGAATQPISLARPGTVDQASGRRGAPQARSGLATSSSSPLLGPEEMRIAAAERAAIGGAARGSHMLQDASGLRVSRQRPGVIGGAAIPATAPSSRREAERLDELLQTLLGVEGGGWEHQCRAYDAALAELVLQVGVHCAERGELLQRCRRHHNTCVRSLREGREANAKLRLQLSEAAKQVETERARGDAAEAQLAEAMQKLDALRAAMLHLKLLRAVHGRKLAAAELRIKELERLIEDLYAALDAAEEAGKSEPVRRRRPPPPAAASSGSSEPVAAGEQPPLRRSSIRSSDFNSAELEKLRQRIAELEELLRKMTLERDELERALRASEAEVAALMAGIGQSAKGMAQQSAQSSAQSQQSTAEKERLQDHVIAARMELEELKSAYAKLQEELDRANEEIERLLAALAKAAEENDALRKEIAALKATLRWKTALLKAADAKPKPKAVVETVVVEGEPSAKPGCTHKQCQTDEKWPEGGGKGKRGKKGKEEDDGGGGKARRRREPRADGEAASDDDDDDDGAPRSAPSAAAAFIVVRKRRKLMVTDLKGAKTMPVWMVHKAVGTLLQARVESQGSGEAKDADEDDDQDMGEFVEDRFVELYGLKKIAIENLRDMLKGLKVASQRHARLRCFRVVTGIVPGDDKADTIVSSGAALFYKTLLMLLVDGLVEDHLSGFRTSAGFWAHFVKTDVIKVPICFYERASDKLASQMRQLQATAPEKSRRARLDHARKIGDGVRALGAIDRTLEDTEELLSLRADVEPQAEAAAKAEAAEAEAKAEGARPAGPTKGKSTRELVAATSEEKAAPVFYVGKDKISTASIRSEALRKIATRRKEGAVCLDSFLERALRHYTEAEIAEEQQLQQAYSSWDLNGDGLLQLDEFTQLIHYANPTESQKTITAAFMAASGDGESVDTHSLRPVLLSYGLRLVPRPTDFVDAPPSPDAAEFSPNPSASADPLAHAQLDDAAGGSSPRSPGSPDGENAPRRGRRGSVALRASLGALSLAWKVGRSLGKSASSLTEEDVLGAAAAAVQEQEREGSPERPPFGALAVGVTEAEDASA